MHSIALCALIYTMQGNLGRAYAVVEEGCRQCKLDTDPSYFLLELLKIEIEIHQSLRAVNIVKDYEKTAFIACKAMRK